MRSDELKSQWDKLVRLDILGRVTTSWTYSTVACPASTGAAMTVRVLRHISLLFGATLLPSDLQRRFTWSHKRTVLAAPVIDLLEIDQPHTSVLP